MNYEEYKMEKDNKAMEITDIMAKGNSALREFLSQYNLKGDKLERFMTKDSVFITNAIYNRLI